MNNKDDHAKNLAFIREEDGRWLLAPPYDLTYCQGVGGEHFMDVSGEGRAPRRSHLLAIAAAAGLAKNIAGRVLDEMLEQVTPAIFKKMGKDLPLKSTSLATVAKAIATNHARLVEA